MGYWSVILPEAATNLITNPSFETNTTGWAAQGTNTIAKSAVAAKFGAYSLKATYQDDATLAAFALTLTASTTYHLSCWVFVPSGWDGGNIRIDGTDYASSASTYNDIYTEGTSTEGIWIYCETKFVADTDTAGTIDIETTSAPTAGKFIYIDAVLVEVNASYATTYVDGDQLGCSWVGAEHASKSNRKAQSRAGGRVYDLDDYGFYVSELTGFGMTGVTPHVQGQALIDGDAYKNYGVNSREFVLVSDLSGTSWTNLHSKRNDLINAMKPDKVKGAQPFLLRYTGADSEQALEIECVYISGLEFGMTEGFNERIGIRIAAYDPFFYEIGNDAAHLATSDSATPLNHMGFKIDGNWIPINESGTHDIEELILYEDYVYAGGWFTDLGGNADADNIARWDRDLQTWSSMGTGLTNRVFCMDIGPDGDLYIGGAFTDAGGDGDADYICKWDGSSLSAVSSGGTGTVNALAHDEDGNLYLGGGFTNWAGNANADYIVKWDGSSWSSLGTGMNDVVRTIDVHPYTNEIYVGGDFETVDGSTVNYIAKWDGSSWSSLGTGCSDFVFAAHFVKGELFIGGKFTTADNVSCRRMAKWNGTTFEPLGEGVNNYVHSINNYNNLLFVGGVFTAAGGRDAQAIAVWNGSVWVNLDMRVNDSSWITTIVPDGDDLYFGGDNFGATSYYSDLTSVTNNGTTKAYPKFVIERSGGTTAQLRFIKNETTGDTLWCDHDLLDGEKLTIDLSPTNRACISSFRGETWKSILAGSDLSSFHLLPGSNDITVFVYEIGAPTLTCYMTWRNAHWSSDGVA